MALVFLETKVIARDVSFFDLLRVLWSSLKIKWAMLKPFEGKWPNASAISHCQITQDDPLRFLVLGDGYHTFEGRPVKLKKYFGFPWSRVIINPEIVWHSTNAIKSVEGCYSFSKQKTRRVQRWEIVDCTYWTFFGKRTKKFYLYRAAVLQHEIDHFNGITIEDRYFNKKIEYGLDLNLESSIIS